jgi:iron(III) transport system permease protein
VRWLAVALALLLGALVVGAPLYVMVAQSLTADRVQTRDGRVFLGRTTDSHAMVRENGVEIEGVNFRVAGETDSRFLPRAEIVREEHVLSLIHYRRVLTGAGEKNMLLATVALAGASTLLALLLGLPLGLLLGATDLPLRRFLENVSVLPLVLPPVLLAIATYHDLLPIKPGFLRAVIVFGLSLFPLVSLLVTRALRETGADALDAARIQVPARTALFRVALGPALPGAAMGALLVFAFTVSDFAVPDFLGVTTAKNTIVVYANAVFTRWQNDGDAGGATAAGMPATALALVAFALVLWIEARRKASTVHGDFRPPDPLPLGRARLPLLVAAFLLLGLALGWPAARHLETTSGAHYGDEVAKSGLTGQVIPESRRRPTSLVDGLRKGLLHDGMGNSALLSIELSGLGALVALLVGLVLVEVGRLTPRLDPLLLLLCFLPIAVPPMSLAVGFVKLWGPGLVRARLFPSLLLAARLLPFAAFAIRGARLRLAPELLEAGAVAGLGGIRRFFRITFPLLVPAAGTGFLLAFLFGLREVDALVFTKSGAETMPVRLYNMIHYGYDVQVAGVSFLWTAGVGLLLLVLALLIPRFRLAAS